MFHYVVVVFCVCVFMTLILAEKTVILGITNSSIYDNTSGSRVSGNATVSDSYSRTSQLRPPVGQ